MDNPSLHIENPDTNRKTQFHQSIEKKQFRFSDWFAERAIKAVAFFSIAFVVLIFIFVFREAAPIFYPKKTNAPQIQKQQENTNTGTNLKPSGYYSDEETATTGELKPESYENTEISENNELKPESYGDTSLVSNSSLKPETYGETVISSGNELKPESYSSNSDESDSVAAVKPMVIGKSRNQINTENYNENQHALSTLKSKDWQPISDNPRYGLIPLILGTLKVTLIALLFAAPISIMAALYTSMFAPPRLREYIKPVIELLAGFPSVVIGFFALMVLASFFQDIFGYASRLNSFVGGIAMGLAAIPVIYTITEDALTAVPRTYIEASLALGASQRQTAFSVVLPAATPGIFAAILLGLGRVFGETMIALMATGNASIISANPFDSVRTLAATIGAEMAEVVFGDTHYSVLFLIGSLLFVFTFALNAVAEFYIKDKLVRRIQGK